MWRRLISCPGKPSKFFKRPDAQMRLCVMKCEFNTWIGLGNETWNSTGGCPRSQLRSSNGLLKKDSSPRYDEIQSRISLSKTMIQLKHHSTCSQFGQLRGALNLDGAEARDHFKDILYNQVCFSSLMSTLMLTLCRSWVGNLRKNFPNLRTLWKRRVKGIPLMTFIADQKSQSLVRLRREYDLVSVIRMDMCWLYDTFLKFAFWVKRICSPRNPLFESCFSLVLSKVEHVPQPNKDNAFTFTFTFGSSSITMSSPAQALKERS